MNERLNRTETLNALPPEPQADLIPAIRAALAESGAKVVILDDDPTGTQTVHDVTVLTSWEQGVITDALHDDAPAVFILTNTRSMTAEVAAQVNLEIGAHVRAASVMLGRDVVLVSRGDSTLRGHFPLETDTLAKAI
ncbi:MAG: four-carbon acid sugar kinase family protein, partial [Chloroflexota bacterium]